MSFSLDFLERGTFTEYPYLKLESIPERRRTVFELSRFYGKSHKEIADKMNISVRTVEQQIYLTLIELRKVLGAFAG